MRCSINIKGKSAERRFKKFINEVSKLEISDFLGLLKMLNIQAVNSDTEPKGFSVILEEVLDKYLKLSNNAQKNLLSILTAANQAEKRGDKFGFTAKAAEK